MEEIRVQQYYYTVLVMAIQFHAYFFNLIFNGLYFTYITVPLEAWIQHVHN